MFAATQAFLTNAFCFVAVASVIWLATELAYFMATPEPVPHPEPQPNPTPTQPIRPTVAPVVATALTPDTLSSLNVTKLRKVAILRGHTGAGRWRKAQLLEVLT